MKHNGTWFGCVTMVNSDDAIEKSLLEHIYKELFSKSEKTKIVTLIRPLGKPFSTFSGFKILLEKSKNLNKTPFCSSGGESCKHILRFLSQALIYANLEMKCLIWSPSKMIKSTFFNIKLAAEIK